MSEQILKRAQQIASQRHFTVGPHRSMPDDLRHEATLAYRAWVEEIAESLAARAEAQVRARFEALEAKHAARAALGHVRSATNPYEYAAIWGTPGRMEIKLRWISNETLPDDFRWASQADLDANAEYDRAHAEEQRIRVLQHGHRLNEAARARQGG